MGPFDVAVIGAGAAGMMAASVAGQRGARVVLIDHAKKLAEKIRISGGGRCNFTNMGATPANFLSDNPHFCKSALARYRPQDFIALVRRHGIAFHEKHKGQLFCDDSSQQIIDMLKAECDAGRVSWRMPCAVHEVTRAANQFVLATDAGSISAQALVIATGGLSIPPIGATDFGYRIAKQFGLRIVPTRPALVPLTFAEDVWAPFVSMAGIALPVRVETRHAGDAKRSGKFEEDLLFTHRGLSGPAMLQISSYWQSGSPITLNLAPEFALADALVAAKRESKKNLANVLGEWLPERLAIGWLSLLEHDGSLRVADLPDKTLRALGEKLNRWQVVPSGTEGYKKAEVTLGGVDTRSLSQQTMQATTVPNLYFIGEVVDVTGWLGGYNFQWAWASGYAAGMAASEGRHRSAPTA